MADVFKNKYKRYLGSRSSRDLTNYAKHQMKKPKICDSSELESKPTESQNSKSISLYHVNPVTQEVFFNDVHDFDPTYHEENNDEYFNQRSLCNKTIEDLRSTSYVHESDGQEYVTEVNDSIYDFFDSEDEDDSLEINKVKSFKELLNSKGFSEKISTPVAVSPSELLLMVLKFCKSLHLPTTGMSKALALINTIFEKPILPQSKYKLDQIFNEETNVEFHAVCPSCTGYISESKDLEREVMCTICNKTVDLSSPSCENLFLIIDPSIAISELLEAHQDYYDYVV